MLEFRSPRLTPIQKKETLNSLLFGKLLVSAACILYSLSLDEQRYQKAILNDEHGDQAFLFRDNLCHLRKPCSSVTTDGKISASVEQEEEERFMERRDVYIGEVLKNRGGFLILIPIGLVALPATSAMFISLIKNGCNSNSEALPLSLGFIAKHFSRNCVASNGTVSGISGAFPSAKSP
ncbi:unnamed protein product [Thlaspi arvense]|uniref:Uncharacterized protein n=1 Tax=Thlaspi arvense TaxID=13288 RepID=A0AAU9S8U4_THLAR|nr:unnamed protein product [Thlaspi arvense]